MNIIDYYRENNKPIKLNLGCRSKPFPGYINIDIDPSNTFADIIDDATVLSTVPEYSVSNIDIVHTLEHFKREDISQILRVWFNKLKNGGILRISVPDLNKCIGLFKLTNNYNNIKAMLYGSQRSEWDYHTTIYDKQSLTNLLTDAGFKNIQEYNYWETFPYNFVDTYASAVWPHMLKKTLCDNGKLIDLGGEQMSLNLEATK